MQEQFVTIPFDMTTPSVTAQTPISQKVDLDNRSAMTLASKLKCLSWLRTWAPMCDHELSAGSAQNMNAVFKIKIKN
jgi:hypothetical protein